MNKWFKYMFVICLAILARDESLSAQAALTVKAFAKGITASNAQILDVRTQEEYNTGYIAGAFLADWTDRSSFDDRIKYLDKSKPVYVYCLSGVRSGAAAKKLKTVGFSEVYSMQNGIQAWKNEDMVLENPTAVKPIDLDSLLQSIKKESVVLVDIGAEWCPPCKRMQPVINDIEKTKGDAIKVIRIDASEQFALVKELGADKLPTFIIYRQGKEVWRKSGLVSKFVLLQHL